MAINNLPKFNNTQPLEVNLSRIGTGSEVPENIKNYTRDSLINWLDVTSFALFVSLIIYFVNVRQYDIYKSVLISSVLTFLVSWAFLISGFSKSITSLITYGTVMLVSGIAVYLNKKKGF